MCGITGIIARTDRGRQRLSKIQQSVVSLEKRGPDDEGVYSNHHVALGHRRLSIIDTSEGGHQPKWDPTHRWVIVFNGEIFNYQQLRDRHFSEEQKAALQSQSDTEILLHLFIRKGFDCLSELEGFFAFAIYDYQENRLYMARDRFGKKPLYIFEDEDNLIFASEMKGILAYEIPKQINYDSLYQYFQLSYIPQPQTILQGVRKLAPGHCLDIRVSEGTREEKPWYVLPVATNYQSALNYNDAQKELVRLLDEAVQKRLVSDVPLGAFLSGGIDSSVVVALASRHVKHFRTFSVGYKGDNFFDETQYAEMVAKKFQTDHTVFYLDHSDYLDSFFPALDYLDEPFADPSLLPQFILSQQTRKYVSVAVSGDGGDEVFAGYNKHYAEWRARRRDLVSFLVRAGHPLWKAMPRNRTSKIGNLVRQLDRFAEGSKLNCHDRYWRWASIHTTDDISRIMTPETLAQVNKSQVEKVKQDALRYLNEEDFNSVLRTDMELVLTGDMLVKVDRLSMANGLEVRSPFLDHHVVEFAFSLPAKYKIKGNHRKRIVRDSFRSLLPPELYHRPKKGFDVPMLNWFKHELNEYLFNDLFKESTIREQGILNPEYIESIRKELQSSVTHDTVEKLWILLSFQYWYNKYMT
ncbi:MAG: asparagine synthase (glutamine-hydrolyzing) [Chitinophagales bacterium]|nr:asparagine synthase (glutamine-hydrolyzing) [Chitinophagales bacterium]